LRVKERVLTAQLIRRILKNPEIMRKTGIEIKNNHLK